MKKRTISRLAAVFAVTMGLVLALSSCSFLKNVVSTIKGELIGNNYVISQYDNFGNLVLMAKGDKVGISGEEDTTGEMSSYLTITIDGYEWEHVGATLVFAQNGVDMITDFQMPDKLESSGDSSGLIAIDRFVNNYRNLMGKKNIVLVSSQNGTPIGIFQGDKCYTEIPGDLPKMTRLNIDGKSVYVHRGTVDIIPVELLAKS